MMRSFLISLSSLSLFLFTNAQEIGNGQLLVNAPTDPLTCEPATIQWVWTGSTSDAQMNTVSIAVEQISSNVDKRRALAEPSPIRFVRKRATLHARDNAINIAGGSSLPMSSGSWTWNSVGVPVGTYRMALSIDGQGITAFSDNFAVTSGPDQSCLGSLASTSTSTLSSQSTSQPSSSTSATASQTTPISSNDANSSTSILPTATNPSSFTTPENQSSTSANQTSKGGPSSGGIAAAVILPLIAVGVLLWLFCMRRQKQQSNEKSLNEWSEKFSGFFTGTLGGNQGHRRQISGPIDPVHASGLAMHDQSVKDGMRQVGGQAASASADGAVTKAPEHWVDFHPDVQETDARLVTPQRMDEMVRASMEEPSRFYQQGSNVALARQSDTTDRHLTLETESDGNSSLPSYLRDADFTSQHTHSSFGHEATGVAVQSVSPDVSLKRNSTQKSNGAPLARSESKIRRKPVPVYSTDSIGEIQAAAASSSLSLATTSDVDDQSPFSDVHEAASTVNHEEHGSSVQSEEVQYGNTSQDQEYLVDSPTLPQVARTPVNVSRSFPVSVYSSVGDSPAPRTLLETPRQSLTEEQKKQMYKISVQLPQEDRGFRVSF